MNYCRKNDADARAHHPRIDAAYRQWFHGCTIERTTNVELDKLGVDVTVQNQHHTLYLEEKIREQYFGDFLIEIHHDWTDGRTPKRTAGWGTDPTKITNYLVYIVPHRGKMWFVDYQALRPVTLSEFRYRPGPTDSPNPKHTTHNVPIPWTDLHKYHIPFKECSF